MDEHLLHICADVVMRYRAHDSYGSDAAALRALRRRAPGYTDEQYRTCFDLLCQVYDRAVEATGRHRFSDEGKPTRYAQPEDIDIPSCMAELEEIEPGVASSQKQTILNWVIFWHYLR